MRFVKLITVLFLLATVTLGLTVVLVHILYPVATCLLYDTRDDQGGNVIAIDPTNGTQLRYRTAPASLPQNPENGDLNPNGTHQIYFTGPQNGPYSLYIDPKPLKQHDGYLYCHASASCWLGKKSPNPHARLIASGIQQQFVALWLDNERIVYSTPTDAQNQTLVVEHIDGSNQHRLPMTFDQRDTIAIQTWNEHFIVFKVTRNNISDIHIWSLPDGKFITYLLPSNSTFTTTRFSPQGNYVMLLGQGQMLILNTAIKERFDFALQSNFYDIEWAPDERHLVLVYQDITYGYQHIIYKVDGTQIPHKELNGTSGMWSKDGRFYLYLSPTAETTKDLMIMHVDSDQPETLASGVYQVYVALDNGLLLALWGAPESYVLGTVNLQTKTRHVITDNITDIGDIRILNNGRTILYMVGHGDQTIDAEVINADGSNHILLARGLIFWAGPYIINEGKSLLFYAVHDHLISLEMIDLDGSNHRTFVTGLEDVRRDIIWSNSADGVKEYDFETPDYIALAGKRNGATTIELVNLRTGDHRILAQGFAEMDGLQMDPRFGGIRFYWEYADHEYGLDVYALDGRPILHLRLPGDYSYSSAYQIFRYFPSPNKTVVAVTDNYDGIKLYFIAPDSSWQKLIEADLSGRAGYTHAWSPDGKQFAFLASEPTGYSIRIVDETGEELHRFLGFTASSDNDLIWTQCR